MHPKQIVKDVESYGAKLLIIDGNLMLENPDKIPSEIEEFVVSHKPRILDYLNGENSDKQYAIDQTMKKILSWWAGEKNKSIDYWSISNPRVIGLLYEFTVELSKNGWKDSSVIYYPYETERSKEIVKELYESAIAFSNRRR